MITAQFFMEMNIAVGTVNINVNNVLDKKNFHKSESFFKFIYNNLF